MINSRLSGVLQALIRLVGRDEPTTSAAMARALGANPVFVRRILAGLRDRGYVTAAMGNGGGWLLRIDPSQLTLLDVYEAIGEPRLVAMKNRSDAPGSVVEQAVNEALDGAFEAVEAAARRQLASVTLRDLHTAALQNLRDLGPGSESLAASPLSPVARQLAGGADTA